jgi:hypothetical protein
VVSRTDSAAPVLRSDPNYSIGDFSLATLRGENSQGQLCSKTWRDYYKVGIKTIKNYKLLADAKLDEITSETSAGFAAYRRAQGLQVTTVNSSLQILRRMLRLAVEWGVSTSAPTERLGGHRIGHSEQSALSDGNTKKQLPS